MGNCHRVGQNLNFFLGHGGDLLDLGELGRLVHGEDIIPLLVVVEVQQTVVGQDLPVLESSDEQELLIGR